jgi:hypothetical protein
MPLTDPRALPPALRLKYIVDAMAMRARGRDARKAAEAKRAKRRAKHAKTALLGGFKPKTRKHMGVVSDELYGPAIHLGCRPWEVTNERI